MIKRENDIYGGINSKPREGFLLALPGLHI